MIRDTSKGVEKDFHGQDPGQSSSSKYIQANTPPAVGDGYGANKIAGTPDDAIIKPQLKTSLCETKSFELPSSGGGLLDAIAGALGSAATALPLPLPFKKTTEKKEIAEATPTGEKAQYGKIRVNQTKGGFVDITDETPGNKRRIFIHPTGTYFQTVDNGDVLEKIVHDKMTIIINDWNISISGNKIEVIDGNNKIQIKKDRQTNINGNDHTNVDKDTNTNIGGNTALQVKGNSSESIQGNFTSEINKNLTEAVKQNYNHTVDGSEFNTVMKDRTDVVCGNLTVTVSGNAVVHVGGNANISVDKHCSVLAKAGIDLDGGSGDLSGVVTQKCICAFTGRPHSDFSANVLASKG